MCAMSFDSREIFANLAEKEKIKGHHSPEGRAIRTLSRALNGWSTGNLAAVDVLALCDQAIEDWLKARLKLPMWSMPNLPQLLEKAIDQKLIARFEAARLRKIRLARKQMHEGGRTPAVDEVESALRFCIQLVEKHW